MSRRTANTPDPFTAGLLERSASAENPPGTERPSGLASSGFTLSIVGFILPGAGILGAILSGVALSRDAHAGRRRWPAAWGLGLGIFATLGYIGVIINARSGA